MMTALFGQIARLWVLAAFSVVVLSDVPAVAADDLDKSIERHESIDDKSIDRDATSEIKAWIDDLDHDRYQAREQAQRKLMLAGGSALEQVVAAAKGKSLEQATRAVRILLEWTSSDDTTLRVKALQQLVDLPESRFRTEIAMAADALADVRQQTAMAEILEQDNSARFQL